MSLYYVSLNKLSANPLSLDSFGRLVMPRPAQFRPLPLPRSWPLKVRRDRFAASATAGIATRPGRPLPGQDSHLLDQRTFYSRRTWTSTLSIKHFTIRSLLAPSSRLDSRFRCSVRSIPAVLSVVVADEIEESLSEGRNFR